MKKEKKKNKNKKDNKIVVFFKRNEPELKKFFNDPRPIIIVLIILVVLYTFAFANFKSKYKVYNGSFASDQVTIKKISVYFHPRISSFYSSGAVYTGEEKKVYQYRIGYYYDSGNGEYNFIRESTESLDNAVDLADIVNKTTYFDYSEFANSGESVVLTLNAKKNMDKLHFMIFASTTKETDYDYDVLIDCPIDFTLL